MVYGVLGDPARTRDVREKVQRIVDGGEISFEVARLAAGDDPAFGVVKTLVVEYTVGGRRVKVTGTDPDVVVLDDPAEAGRAAELGRDGEGRLCLKAWREGTCEVRWASGRARRVEVAAVPPPVEIAGPWEVRFAPGGGAPARIILDELVSWNEHGDPGVRHFSGAATYRGTFRVPDGMPGPDRRLTLDLGRVQVMAEVRLNGKDMGVLWKPPYAVDVTDAVRAGENALEVKVVNLWINRMIGDEELPEDSERRENGTLKKWPDWLQEGKSSPTGRFTFTSWRLWKRGDPLQESGLLGPVVLRASVRVPVAP